MPLRIQKYGWKPDIPDRRDFAATRPPPIVVLPEETSLRPSCPPVYDQTRYGSCVSNGVKFGVDFQRVKQGLPLLDGSRFFIYYNGRIIEGEDLNSDSGLMVRNGIKSVVAYGVCPESLWPYEDANFAAKPTPACYAEAVTHKTLKYARVLQTLYGLKYQVAVKKIPVIFGFTVYESFESEEVAKTGIMPIPHMREKAVGGHCVALMGYDNARKSFEVRNSWGADWGDQGYFWMPYDYVIDCGLADDFWEITLE